MPLGTKVKPVFNPKPAASVTVSKHFNSTRGKLIALIGKPGMGKTSLAAEFPNPYFICDEMETGAIDLISEGAIDLDMDYVSSPMESWMDVLRFNDSILEGSIALPSERKTLVYESISGFEKQCIKYCCDADFGGQMKNTEGGYHFFGKGDRNTGDKYWPMLMKQFLKLNNAGYNVILTGHSEVRNEKNPMGSDYMVEACACSNPVWKATDYFMSNIFFLSYLVESGKEDGNKFARPKALGVSQKVLIGFKTPFQAAKNRCGKDKDISLRELKADDGAKPLYLRLCKACGWNPQTLGRA